MARMLTKNTFCPCLIISQYTLKAPLDVSSKNCFTHYSGSTHISKLKGSEQNQG